MKRVVGIILSHKQKLDAGRPDCIGSSYMLFMGKAEKLGPSLERRYRLAVRCGSSTLVASPFSQRKIYELT